MKSEKIKIQKQDSRYFAGIPVYDLDNNEAIEFIRGRLSTAQKTLLMFANSNFVVKCQSIKEQLVSSNVLVFNDGLSIDFASKFLYGKSFKSNLNGTDFTPKLMLALTQHQKVVLIGSKPGVSKRAGDYLAENFGSKVLATFDGFDDIKNHEALISKVNLLKPDIVMVGIGNPLQEVWMLDNADVLDAPLILGVGALFDFISGTVQRAPSWVRNLRLEWLYRLSKEPRRLGKRYSIDVLTFLYLCIIDRIKTR
jgi:beta-1,4-glucosyltransferase